MTNETLPSGLDPEAIKQVFLARYPETVAAEAMGAIFFSLDESHWPNYATIVTTDEHDVGAPSNLSARPGAYRLNIGVGRETFERLVAEIDEPDHAALDRILPHPVYAKQHWVAILNPSEPTFRDVVPPLVAEAHDRLAAQRAKHRKSIRAGLTGHSFDPCRGHDRMEGVGIVRRSIRTAMVAAVAVAGYDVTRSTSGSLAAARPGTLPSRRPRAPMYRRPPRSPSAALWLPSG